MLEGPAHSQLWKKAQRFQHDYQKCWTKFRNMKKNPWFSISNFGSLSFDKYVSSTHSISCLLRMVDKFSLVFLLFSFVATFLCVLPQLETSEEVSQSPSHLNSRRVVDSPNFWHNLSCFRFSQIGLKQIWIWIRLFLFCSFLFTFSIPTAIGSLPAVIISICPQSSICSLSEIWISKRNETAAATFAMEVGLVKDESKLLVWGISNIKLECCQQHICYWQHPSLYIYIYTFMLSLHLTKWLFKVMVFHHTYWFTFLPRI